MIEKDDTPVFAIALIVASSVALMGCLVVYHPDTALMGFLAGLAGLCLGSTIRRPAKGGRP